MFSLFLRLSASATPSLIINSNSIILARNYKPRVRVFCVLKDLKRQFSPFSLVKHWRCREIQYWDDCLFSPANKHNEIEERNVIIYYKAEEKTCFHISLKLYKISHKSLFLFCSSKFLLGFWDFNLSNFSEIFLYHFFSTNSPCLNYSFSLLSHFPPL